MSIQTLNPGIEYLERDLLALFDSQPLTVEQKVRREAVNLFSIVTKESNYTRYQTDPIAFGENELGQTYTDEVKVMMESVRDNRVTYARSANGVGKTFGAADIGIWFYKAFPDSQVYTTAAPPEGNLKRLLWGEIGNRTETHPSLFGDDQINVLHIARSPKSFLTGVTIPASGTSEQREAKFSGKHAPNLLFIVDEGDAVPEEVYKGIESCMSGGHVRLLVLFNPRMKSGTVYRNEQTGQAKIVHLSAFNHPNVRTRQNVIPGAVDRETTTRRINQWTRPLTPDEKPDNECFTTPDFLVGYVARRLDGTDYLPLPPGTRKITNPTFSYMVLGEYPAQASNQLISEIWLNDARARWDAYVAKYGEIPPKDVKPLMGLDVAEFGADSNAECFRYGGWVAPIITWGDMDPDATATRAAEDCKVRKAIRANVDGTGVGAGVAPKMTRLGCKAESIKVASSPTVKVEEGEFDNLRDQLWWLTREWLRTDPGAMLPPDEILLEELSIPTYQVRNGKLKIMSKDVMKDLLKRSPDRAESLILTFAPKPKWRKISYLGI